MKTTYIIVNGAIKECTIITATKTTSVVEYYELTGRKRTIRVTSEIYSSKTKARHHANV